jgi:hypothetical protein
MEEIIRQKIARECAEEIVALSEHGAIDQEIVELIVMTALVRQENATSARLLGQLGAAFKERRDAA